MTIINTSIDNRVFDAYKTERANLKSALKRGRYGNVRGQITTASEQRQIARQSVLQAMAEDVFESRGIELTHRIIKDIVDAREGMSRPRS